MTAIWKTWSELPQAFTSDGLHGAKKRFFFGNRLWTLTKRISATEHDINNRKEICQSTGTPLHGSRNLVNFGPEMAERGWRVFAHPAKYSHRETASLNAWKLYNRQQANFGMCYVVTRAYSLEQQNAGRAHAALCHASSVIYNVGPIYNSVAVLGNVLYTWFNTEIYIFRLHRIHAVHKMRPIVTDVARSVVCVSVCVLVKLGHTDVPCKIGRTDRDAFGATGQSLVDPKNHAAY